jgi:hypothetical protein
MKTASRINSGRMQIHLTYFSLLKICDKLGLAAELAATEGSDIGLLPH